MNIIPKPKYCTYLHGTYAGGGLTVTQEAYDAQKIAWELFAIPVTVVENGSENVIFYQNPLLKEEEYELIVRKQEIEIYHSTAQGAFRALSTLKQILNQGKKEAVRCVKIHDLPDIPVRGLMIMLTDECVLTLDRLKKIVDLMANVKLNMLQPYFDTFVFEYASFREYLEGKAYLTQAEIHELDEYCKARHVELMANQELLGHMHRWLAQDEFKHLGIQVDDAPLFTLNPLLDGSFEMAKRIIDDLLPHFSSSFVNIGMDEAYGLGKKETENYCRTFGEAALLADYITKVNDYIKTKYHKRSMFWGDYAVKYPDTMKMLPKDLIFVDWGYEPGHNFDRNILAAKEAGLDVYVAPGTQTWGTFSGKTDVMVENIFQAAEAGRFHKVQGFLLTDWSIVNLPTINDLCYVFGAAFSWNAGYNNSIAESGNEDNCSYRNEIVHSVLQYFDEEVLQVSGDRSCAEIIYKMGNYYHFEQPDSVATWNGTQLYNHLLVKGLARGQLSAESLLDIIGYMRRLKSQLDDCKLSCQDNEMILTELKLECDTVIAAANALGIKNTKGTAAASQFQTPDLEELANRRREVWVAYNKLTPSAEARIQFYNSFAECLN